jgi:hypothetical protein
VIGFGKWHRLAGAGRLAVALGVCAAVAGGACGKKGPPLPPLVSLPAAVENLTARRLGSQVVVQFNVPTRNTDGSHPADLLQVEIYAHTGRLASAEECLRDGTLVGTVQVGRPAANGEEGAAVPGAEPGLEQGAVAAWSETLTPAALTLPAVIPAPPAQPPESAPPVPLPGSDDSGLPAAGKLPGAAVASAPPGRFYVTVGVNRRGRRGALSPVVVVPIVPSPPPPSALRVTYGQDQVSLAWLAGGQTRDAPVPAADQASPAEQTATPAPDTFNVYEVPRAAGSEAPDSGTAQRTPMPVNASPLAARSFDDARIEFGKERCYAVRTVLAVGDLSVESDPSPFVCVTPVDTFPPAAPRSLAGVSSENAINLIWEASTEKDLAGYLVLRAEAPGEKLAAVTPAPIHDTTYHDGAVRRGVTYVYAVVAVDTATPPNVSEQSNRTEETVR